MAILSSMCENMAAEIVVGNGGIWSRCIAVCLPEAIVDGSGSADSPPSDFFEL